VYKVLWSDKKNRYKYSFFKVLQHIDLFNTCLCKSHYINTLKKNMSHTHEKGFHCSCCSPLYNIMMPKNLTVKKTATKNTKEEKIPPAMIFRANEDDNSFIHTMKPIESDEEEDVRVKAIGIYNGEIIAVGTNEEVNKAMKEYQVEEKNDITLKNGQTITPGFIEPHVHILPSAAFDLASDLSPFEGQYLRSGYDREVVLRMLQIYADKAGDTKWVFGRNVDPSLFVGDGGKGFDADVLKEIKGNNPIFLMNASMHFAYINETAINILRASKEPNKYNGPELNDNGILEELAEIGPVLEFVIQTIIPENGVDNAKNVFKESVLNIIDTASAQGITYLLDAGVVPRNQEESPRKESEEVKSDQADYLKAIAEDNCSVRISGAIICESLSDYNNKVKNHYSPKRKEGYKEFNTPFVKIMADGSNQGLTGLQFDPYCCDENYVRYDTKNIEPKIENQNNVGVFNYGYPVEFESLIEEANKDGWPTMTHVNGDQTLSRIVKTFQKAQINKEGKVKRHRIEHASLISDENFEILKNHKISPSFLIGHVGYWGWQLQNTILGEERTHLLDRCKTSSNEDNKMRFTLHSDYGVSPLGPLRMMEQAITRQMESAPEMSKEECKIPFQDKILTPKERITRFQALRAMTYDAAWQCYADDFVGSLEEGKCADFVILEQSPLEYVNPDYVDAKDGSTYAVQGMRDIPVLQTWKGGVVRFDRNVKSFNVTDKANLRGQYSTDAKNIDPIFFYDDTEYPEKSWSIFKDDVEKILSSETYRKNKVQVYTSGPEGYGTFFVDDEKNQGEYQFSKFKEPIDLYKAIIELLEFSLNGE
jgi:predicted amidohydrolase YtcJ